MTNAATAVIERPTRERIAHARGCIVDEPSIDLKMRRSAYRIVGAVETMFRQGKISPEQWQAFDRFETDCERAAIQPKLIGGYGSAASSGTPLAQMAAHVIEAAETREGRRSEAIYRVEGALAAVRVPRMQSALMLAVQGEGLERIGMEVSRYRDRGKAIAVAHTALEDALCLLSHHYASLYGQAQIAP